MISSDEAANLSIFKAVVKECNQLREINLRKKIICLKNSQILNAAKNSKEDRTAIEVQTLRRNLLN